MNRGSLPALLLLLATSCFAQPSSLFRFETDDFWLNLHHFLYVLGRAEAKTPDSNRAAVASAPSDAAAGLQELTPGEDRLWGEAVSFYAKGLSLRDAVFDDSASKLTLALAGKRDTSSLAGLDANPEVVRTLQQAAPMYRRAWWPRHHLAKVARRVELQKLVNAHGERVLAFITRAYGMKWPAEGFPVHFSGYANWAGAYSTGGILLVFSSLDSALAGTEGLETIFHEGMHQWDARMIPLLEGHARALRLEVPPRLSHAMIFYTAGEAVRSIFPEHVPYASANGVWKRGLEPLRQALEAAWKPWLEGRGTRDAAIDRLLKRCAQ